ncbi:GlxA family transcriptional regulator [Pantoea anthophila]|uniref:Helix-turn-helix domain-containing protein n=1 Tax=Pantoea anthophila TaxID=470931 RepID=A0ABY2Z4S4_9GAMM|nr:helix-turn-helix domain-containing protein [Pantoea anthophila]TPV23641.1 helix-turn-helix domain-containing protein [Pantoea anthophila]
MPALSVAVIATEGFSPFHFSIPCTVFGKVYPDPSLFELTICAAHTGAVQSDLGLSIQVANGLEVLEAADIVIVPFWNHPETRPPQVLLDSLRKAHSGGAEIVGLCLGTYVLAYAGLLNSRRASTHWEFEKDFSERFPDVRLDTNALYVDDDRLITSAGTAAALDCCLYLVRQHYGSTVANKLARRLVVPPHREGGQAQFIDRPLPQSTQDGKINELINYLRRNISKPHSLDSLASFTNMSRRTFTRHFHKATGIPVSEWLDNERLHRCQELLENTSHSIEQIAQLAGFGSTVTLRQSFKARFGVSPSDWRKTFNVRKDLL